MRSCFSLPCCDGDASGPGAENRNLLGLRGQALGLTKKCFWEGSSWNVLILPGSWQPTTRCSWQKQQPRAGLLTRLRAWRGVSGPTRLQGKKALHHDWNKTHWCFAMLEKNKLARETYHLPFIQRLYQHWGLVGTRMMKADACQTISCSNHRVLFPQQHRFGAAWTCKKKI